MRHIALSLFSFVAFFSCLSDGEAGRISLSGEGTVSAVPDRASFELTFRETGETTRDAGEAVNRLAGRALAVLDSYSIPPENIRTTGIGYYRKTAWDDGQEIILGQEGVQTIRVSLVLEEAGSDLSNLIDELILIDGLGLGSLQMTLTSQSPYREQARKAAYEDALSRAEHYAALSGRKLGKLLELREGTPGRTPERPMLMSKSSAEGETQIQTGTYDITVVIETVFALE
jgi:uncharacterized protein